MKLSFKGKIIDKTFNDITCNGLIGMDVDKLIEYLSIELAYSMEEQYKKIGEVCVYIYNFSFNDAIYR